MPKVSVVIPSYNHAAYIKQAVQSVLDQSLTDLELIIVDDGSRDDTLKILESIHDSRVQLISQENRGAHAAINRGLELASGTYCAILNSDDVYHPKRLETLVNRLDADPSIALAATHIEIIDIQGKVVGIKHGYKDLEPWLLAAPERSFRAGDDLHAALLTENYLATTSNYLFRREWHQKVGGFRPLRYTHDWDFALRIARQSRIELVSEPLLQYRIHPTNTIRENQAAMAFEICWCLAVHLPQHLADRRWFEQAPCPTHADQLLNSIYTYGNELVLSVLLLSNLDTNQDFALTLLDANNELRQRFLQSIQARMAPPAMKSVDLSPNRVRKAISRIKQLLIQRS